MSRKKLMLLISGILLAGISELCHAKSVRRNTRSEINSYLGHQAINLQNQFKKVCKKCECPEYCEAQVLEAGRYRARPKENRKIKRLMVASFEEDLQKLPSNSTKTRALKNLEKRIKLLKSAY